MSIATVSRVLTATPRSRPRTRELVRGAVERWAHRADRRAGAAGGAGAVFVRCPYVLTDYFGLIVSSIAETLDLHGRQVMLNAGEATQTQPGAAGPARPARGSAGAIMVLPPEPGEDLERLRGARLPVRGRRPAHTAAAGHRRGVGRPLRRRPPPDGPPGRARPPPDRGDRRPATTWLASDARLAGHTAALADGGVLPAPELLRCTRADHRARLPGRRRAARPAATARPRWSVSTTRPPSGALRAAAERGLRVPEDLSITGFDDIDLSPGHRARR